MATAPQGQKISQLELLQAITGNEIVAVAYQGQNYKVSLSAILAAVNLRIDTTNGRVTVIENTMVRVGTTNW